MSLVLNILIGVVVIIALFAVMRRYQMKAAKVAQAEGLAAALLSEAAEKANRQALADVLKLWNYLSRPKQTELRTHLATHPRLKGVDLRDPEMRERTYMDLVGIAKDQSPEK